MATTTNQAVAAPMTDQEALALLAPHEVVRDPIHGDITITALERAIIDTTAFQRLRSISQLGPTQLVYPGAVHTRFLHSIGTLHWAEQLVQIANHNSDVYQQATLLRIDPYPHVLARLCALLHDVAQMPFGHTLEDEGNLFEPEWKDSKRVRLWLGEKSEIAQAVVKFLCDARIAEAHAQEVFKDVSKYVTHDGDPMCLDYPFIVDLVGNTLCADLLDYLDRDMHFCGLRERSGDRVVKYLAVVRVESSEQPEQSKPSEQPEQFKPSKKPARGKGRVVLLTYRFEREHLASGGLKEVKKPEILSEAIDLLRRRLALAEKVYFHRTKIGAAAMLISAVGSSSLRSKLADICRQMDSGAHSKEQTAKVPAMKPDHLPDALPDALVEFYSTADSGLIDKLTVDSDQRTKHLIEKYNRRRLYRILYQLPFVQELDARKETKDLWQDLYPNARKPDWRREKEDFLEIYSDLPAGSVAIYCPDKRMNLKEFDLLVQSLPDSEIKPLRSILDPNRKLEMDAINQRFNELWSLQVLVDPDVMDVSQTHKQEVQNLNALCESRWVIDYPNGIGALRGKGRALEEQLADGAVRDYERTTSQQVPHNLYREMVQTVPGSAARGGPSGLSELMEAFQQFLRERMEQKPSQAIQPELGSGDLYK